MPDTLKDKIALVTGAGSGIGRATSLVLAREGATIVVSDVNADGGEETLSAIKDMGGDGMFVHADVSRAADVAALVDATVAAYGRLDCAYNNALASKDSWADASTNTRKTPGTASWTST